MTNFRSLVDVYRDMRRPVTVLKEEVKDETLNKLSDQDGDPAPDSTQLSGDEQPIEEKEIKKFGVAKPDKGPKVVSDSGGLKKRVVAVGQKSESAVKEENLDEISGEKVDKYMDKALDSVEKARKKGDKNTSAKRDAGMTMAMQKVYGGAKVKATVKEEEQLDELSPATHGSYAQAALRGRKKAVDTALNAHAKAKKNTNPHLIKGPTKLIKGPNHVDGVQYSNKAPSKHDEVGKALHTAKKRDRGLALVYARSKGRYGGSHDQVKEDTIQELSVDTVKNYKAATQKDMVDKKDLKRSWQKSGSNRPHAANLVRMKTGEIDKGLNKRKTGLETAHKKLSGGAKVMAKESAAYRAIRETADYSKLDKAAIERRYADRTDKAKSLAMKKFWEIKKNRKIHKMKSIHAEKQGGKSSSST